MDLNFQKRCQTLCGILVSCIYFFQIVAVIQDRAVVPVRQSDRASQTERMVVPVCQQHRIQIDTAGCDIRSGQAQRRCNILSAYSVPVQRIPVGVQKLLFPESVHMALMTEWS